MTIQALSRPMARRTLLTGIAAAASLAATGALAQTPAELKGQWSGVLVAGSARLRVRLDIGEGTATLFSLDQGATPIPGEVKSLTPASIHVEFPALQARYTGKLVGDRIEGELFQGAALPLVLTRGAAPAAAAPPAPLAAMTPAVLADLRAKAGTTGMAAAAMARGGAPKVWVDGERAAGSGVKVAPGDLWHLGSITKSMTATLIGRLVDAGKISWDDTVGDVLGKPVPQMRDEYRRVTFRHLLSHRSGLPGHIAEAMTFQQINADPRAERVRWAQLALASAPAGPAETTFLYSNNGYVVAGAMLEQKLGKSWETLITQHLFKPLKLSSAGFGAPGRKGAVEQPQGHLPGPDGKWVPVKPGDPVTDNPAALGPAGRAHMTLQDLLTYAAAHRDQGPFLKPETWKTLHTPPFGGDYAMGWVARPNGDLWHNGSNTMWYAEVLVSPTTGKVACASANDGETDKTMPAVGRALASAAMAV